MRLTPVGPSYKVARAVPLENERVLVAHTIGEGGSTYKVARAVPLENEGESPGSAHDR